MRVDDIDRRTRVGTDGAWHHVAATRRGSDGLKTDILWRHALSGQNVMWFMDGINLISGSFTNPSMPDNNWKIVGPRWIVRSGGWAE